METSLDLESGRPRVVVEAKAEHDWDATGREFGAALRNDVEFMGGQMTIPEMVDDVYEWYQQHPRRPALRRSPTWDLIHLLFGVCCFSPAR